MHEELMAAQQYSEIKVVSYLSAKTYRRNHLPFELVPYTAPDINWGYFDYVNPDLDSEEQLDFVRRMSEIIEKFKPDVLHGHYLGTALLLSKLAELHQIPFTLRTHSFDMLERPGRSQRRKILFSQVANPLCIGIFTFPEFVDSFRPFGVPDAKVWPNWPMVNVKRFENVGAKPRTAKVICAGPCVKKKGQAQFVDLALRMRDSGLEFNLYAACDIIGEVRSYNNSQGNPVNICYADPEDMGEVYREHDWLVYTTDISYTTVGLPVGIAEAQASGVGVCWQRIPGRESWQMDYMGGAGILYDSTSELEPILQHQPDEVMIEKGRLNARKCDASEQVKGLVEVWLDVDRAHVGKVDGATGRMPFNL